MIGKIALALSAMTATTGGVFLIEKFTPKGEGNKNLSTDSSTPTPKETPSSSGPNNNA